MVNIKNAAYFGTNGTITVAGDNHFGVTSCALVPTAQEEQVVDIAGDVQSFVGDNMWKLQLTFHQDHKTAGALSRQSIGWHGTPKTVEYTPQSGGDKLTVTCIWKAAQVGGDTGRRSATLDLAVIGQPVVTAPPTGKTSWAVTVTGAPTGGTYTLVVNGYATAPIAHNATAATVAAALNALSGVTGITGVTGAGTITLTFPTAVMLTGTSALTGGATPAITVA